MGVVDSVRGWVSSAFRGLAAVVPVSIGRPNDGTSLLIGDAYGLDRSYGVLAQEFQDIRELEKVNPLAKRIISATTAAVVGKMGVTFTSTDESLNEFIEDFSALNLLQIRQPEWCSELTRSGELCIALHVQEDSGMSLVRVIPSIKIERVCTLPGDYEVETEYHEFDSFGASRVWYSPHHEKSASSSVPIVLHYAINRPCGELRGTSDLAPIIRWLRRYDKLLEGRVVLNLAIRSFVWVVSIPTKFWDRRKNTYRRAPAPGSILTVPEGETITAVSPNLQARDFRQDRVAVLEMVAAGTTGLTPLDFGDLETSNLSTAQVVERGKEVLLAQRQAFFAHVLSDVIVRSYNRRVRFMGSGSFKSLSNIETSLPEILKQDSLALAASAKEIMAATEDLALQIGSSNALRRLVLRLFSRFSGESLSDEEFEGILGGAVDE